MMRRLCGAASKGDDALRDFQSPQAPTGACAMSQETAYAMDHTYCY